MNLNEYIRQSYKRPNRRILETLGASEGLIEYLMETPGNTNWKVVEAINGSGSDGPSGPYTFHFTLQETEESRTRTACDEIDKWLSYFNSVQSGMIVKATLSNAINSDDEPVTIVPEHSYSTMKYKDDEILGGYSGVSMCQWAMNHLEVSYYPNAISNYIIANDNMYKQIDITLEIQPGYKITIDASSVPEEGQYIDYYYIAIEPGESYKIPFNNTYTNKTNTYTKGDIITPTSDMTLVLVSG